MDESVKSVLTVILGLAVGVIIYYAWGYFRPMDSETVKIGVGIIAAIISALFLHYSSKG